MASTVSLRGPILRTSEEALAIGYLRALVVLLVLAHHSILAYHPFAPFPQASLAAEPRSWRGFPIVDSQRSIALLLLATFNDIFLMSLLFLVSGLFVWPSWQRRGAWGFLRRRLVRLGVPFVVAATLLTPLAYVPSYLVTSGERGASGFFDAWLTMGLFPGAAGPAWFLWVLLMFDAVATVLLARVPGSGACLGRTVAGARDHPAVFFGLLVVVPAVAYLPLALAVGPATWSTFGPLTIQTSRCLHYLVYFLAGVALGIHGLERGPLAATGSLARHWDRWVVLAALAFMLTCGLASYGWTAVAGGAFVLSCAASSCAALAVCIRFLRTRTKSLDSLRDNSYGMFVVHFVFVTWLQYALLRAPLPAVAKGTLVFLGTAGLSWSITAALRRVPAIARVI